MLFVVKTDFLVCSSLVSHQFFPLKNVITVATVAADNETRHAYVMTASG